MNRQMRAVFAAIVGFAALGPAAPASAQQPTEAQIDAIKKNCRSDFMSRCRGVKTGGSEAVQCLKDNKASLSGGCAAAIGAISPAPAPAAAKPAPTPAAPPPAAAVAAPAAPPAAAAPAVPAPATVAEPAKPKLASAPTAPVPAKPATAAAPAAPAPKPAVSAAPAPAAPADDVSPAARKLTLRDVARIRRSCFEDIGLHCKHIPAGQNRILDCLAAQEPALVPACKQAIAQARQ